MKIKWLSILFCLLCLSTQTGLSRADDDDDTAGSGLEDFTRIIKGPGRTTDPSWEPTVKLMQQVAIFDQQVDRMISVFCGKNNNRSVLLVGEPSDTYRYLWARLAAKKWPAGCAEPAHADVLISKLEGHMYVGTTERNWQNFVEANAYNKNVILYFDNLSLLIGTGTSEHNRVGIESTYASDFKAGKLKTVAFMNKYDYNRMIKSQYAYVLNSFQETINLSELDMKQVDALARKYVEVLAPNLRLTDKVAQYLYRNVAYYMPNSLEPQRTLGVLESIIRAKGGGGEQETSVFNPYPSTIALAGPYANNLKKSFDIYYPGAKSIQLVFSYFHTESQADYLYIIDTNKKESLQRLGGALDDEELTTERFETDHLTLTFQADESQGNYRGFKVSSVIVEMEKAPVLSELTTDDVRSAIMKIAQVPQWIMDRDYSIIREFPKLINEDVVGVEEGKRDIIKQVKIGYVSGRTDEKPAGTLLFVGPTGTGKSYLAKKTADFMKMKLITIDMTQYATADSFDRFLDTVSDSLVLNPFAVYLFEEIDKASVKVLDRLYFMLDEGVFYDKNQRPMSARGALILMTTNAGENVIIRERNNPNLRNLVNQELQKFYRPSFLNRFDATPIFFPFTDEQFHQLAATLVKKKVEKLKDHFDWELSVDKDTIFFIGANGRSDVYGARPMERLVENVISIAISEYQLQKGNVPYGGKLAITKVAGQKFRFKISLAGDEGIIFEADPSINTGKSLTPPIGFPLNFWMATETAAPMSAAY